MQAGFAVELGADDEAMEFPWADAEGRWQYRDVKRRAELLAEIEEAQRFPELGEFLAAVNASAGKFESAKCDAWFSREMDVEDEVFGASCKFGSYVDLLFAEEAARFEFDAHEKLAQRLTMLLRRAPEIPAAAEFMVRRCYYGQRAGFYVTFYLLGYGDDEAQARQRWGIGLKLVENALRQVGAERRDCGETGTIGL